MPVFPNLAQLFHNKANILLFFSCKLNNAQTHYIIIKKELLSIVETLKKYCNILLGYSIKVYTDHKNLVYKHFNTDCVIYWHLLLKEYGPEFIYIKGQNNIVANALS